MLELLLFLGSFVFMEGVAYITHKYVMHGFLWSLHESHHRPREGLLRKKRPVRIFLRPAVDTADLAGRQCQPDAVLPIGTGLTAYGLFLLRLSRRHSAPPAAVRYRGNNAYMKRIIQAHYVHHATHHQGRRRILRLSLYASGG